MSSNIFPNLSQRFFAVLTIVSLLLSMVMFSNSALAESTGVTVNSDTLTTAVDERVNFVVSTTYDGSTTPNTVVSVSDGGAGGSFYKGTIGGACNLVHSVDSDNEFSIDKNEGICYSNSVAGVYNVTVQLLDGPAGNPIGNSVNVEVTVEDDQNDSQSNPDDAEEDPQGTLNDIDNAYTNPTGSIDICHVSGDGNQSISVNLSSIINGTGHGGHANDIIPPFWYQLGDEDAELYLGKNWTDEGIETYQNDCSSETDDSEGGSDEEPTEPEDPWCSFTGSVIEATADVDAKQNDGDLVEAARRNLTAVETIAPYQNVGGNEGNNWQVDPLDFFSLGIGGFLVYEFTGQIVIDQPGSDIAIYEITGGGGAPTDEKVEVSVSQDGVSFVTLGEYTGDAEIDISSAGLEYVKFVRLDDKSHGIQGNDGDGYDVDAIVILQGSCDNEPKEPVFGPYCGDGQVNQEWEQCEIGEEGCTDYCLYENQCQDIGLVKITMRDLGQTEGSFNETIYLGNANKPIPNGTWFWYSNLSYADSQSAQAIAYNTTGLGVHRNGNSGLDLAVRGNNSEGVKDYLFASVEVLGLQIDSTDRTLAPGWKLEWVQGNDNAKKDIFKILNPNKVNIRWTMEGSDNDGGTINLSKDEEEYNCPICDENSTDERCTNPEPDTYTISGYKWNDLDKDGEWSTNTEPGLSNWEIVASNGSVVATTTTDSDGYYEFVVSATGTWTVAETNQTGWIQTAPDSGECSVDFGVSLDDPTSLDCNFGNYEEDDTETNGNSELSCDFFFPNRDSTGVGNKILLSWQVSGAQEVSVDNEVGAVPSIGNVEVTMPDFGTTMVYTLTATSSSDETVTCSTSIIVKKNSGGGSSSGGNLSTTQFPAGIVAGESTTTPMVAGDQCGLYLTDYMRINQVNDLLQVVKLQVFLNQQGFVTPLTGIFDVVTDLSVKSFQDFHKADVLQPWFDLDPIYGLEPTGWVYKTTKWKINDIKCPNIAPFPILP
jgi:hypothetical protein